MLKKIFIENWKGISLSYLLLILSNVLVFIYPKVLGNCIDYLINGDYSYLINLGLVFFGFLFLSYLSNIYDTKVFARIHRKISSIEITKQFDKGIDSGVINGRYTMLYNIVSFFERDVASIITTLFGICGSLYIIFSINYIMGIGLLISGLISLFLTKVFTPKISKITREKNNLYEEQTKVINERKIPILNNFLRTTEKLSIKYSNVHAKYTLLIQFVAYFTVTILLFYYIKSEVVTVGNTFSTYRYLFDFVGSVASLPYIINSIINLVDVIKRFKEN